MRGFLFDLEMGIDIGSVDLVIQVGSQSLPTLKSERLDTKSVTRARFPTSPHDLVELVALQMAILEGEMDLLKFPENFLMYLHNS